MEMLSIDTFGSSPKDQTPSRLGANCYVAKARWKCWILETKGSGPAF